MAISDVFIKEHIAPPAKGPHYSCLQNMTRISGHCIMFPNILFFNWEVLLPLLCYFSYVAFCICWEPITGHWLLDHKECQVKLTHSGETAKRYPTVDVIVAIQTCISLSSTRDHSGIAGEINPNLFQG